MLWRAWEGRMRAIDRDIEFAEHQRQTMTLTMERIVRPNPQLMNFGNRRFLDDAWGWYGVALGIAVRRLVDSDKRTKSMVVLLRSVATNPGAFAAETIANLYPASIEDIRERISDVADRSGTMIDVLKLTADIEALDSESLHVRKWVNDYVAHGRYREDYQARREADQNVPKYNDLYAALEAIQAITLKYAKVFLGRKWGYAVAEVDPDEWLDVFNFAWRPSSAASQ
jgi:hypothetical protein